jgi:hypothetical protein
MVTAEPVLSFDIDVTASDDSWVQRGNHAVWRGKRDTGETPYVLHEWSAEGVRVFRVRDDKPVFHRVPGGTPYHVSHLFGFWTVNDVDAMWLTAPRGGTTYYMLTVGGLTEGPLEATCLFVCPSCAARFGETRCDGLRGRYTTFIAFALARVRKFNADAAMRTCPRCGAVHPPIYGFHAASDTPDERAARAAG